MTIILGVLTGITMSAFDIKIFSGRFWVIIALMVMQYSVGWKRGRDSIYD